MPHAAIRSSYDLFAAIYSRWMAEDFCRRAWPVIDQLWLSRLPPRARLLDVCCGTGQIAHALGEQGFQVTGVDISEPMLRLARRNAPLADFVLADARSFALANHDFQGALSTFNSLAHLKDVTELQEVFRNVRAVLVAEAPFLFDISTEQAYATKWQGRFQYLAADCTCTVAPTYDSQRRLGRNHVTVSGENGQHAEFYIEQQCHSEQDLRRALKSAGFTRIELYDAERDLGMTGEGGRSFFLCS